MAQSEYPITFAHRFAGWVGVAFVQLVARTSAVQKSDDPSYLSFHRALRPVIYAFWHNNQVFLAWAHRGEPSHVIVSRSKDGEYIAQVMKHLRIGAIRGSSTRGGDTAFRQLCAALERGESVAFTPDGPRGPAQTVQPGVVAAAQASGVPIVPVAVASRRKLVFRSWDRFFVPLPFSHIVVHHGRPFWIGADEAAGTAAQRVRVALNAAVEAADAAERAAPSWWSSAAGAVLNLIYASAVFLAAPLLLAIFLVAHGFDRTFRNLGERLGAAGVGPADGRRFWLHAASVGEWQAMRPILRELRNDPSLSFIVTVSSPEARALLMKEEPGLPVRMVPLDVPLVVRKWIRKVRPDAVLIAETELWPNLLARLHRADIPVFIINGRMSARSASRWRLLRPMARRLMSKLSHFFVRTQLDGQRFCSLGAPVNRVTITGNTKVDNLLVLSPEARAARRRAFFGDAPGILLLAGSTWPGEEEVLAKLAATRAGVRLRVIIAPRAKARFAEVALALAATGASLSRWSDAATRGNWTSDILLVDTLGDLKDLYGACDIAFVGGSVNPRGGQNPLEPAAAGVPVLFGPSMTNFHEEAVDLKKAGGGRQSRHAGDLAADILELAANEDLRRSMGAAAARFVTERQGAARRTADAVRAALLVERKGA